MHIGGEGVENLRVNMVLKKKFVEKIQIGKDIFSCLFTLEWAK
jgi:hypothetical protein